MHWPGAYENSGFAHMRISNFYMPYAQFWNKNSKIFTITFYTRRGQKLDFFGASRRVHFVFYVKLSNWRG